MVVEALLAEGLLPDLSTLKEHHQAQLARDIAGLRRVDRDTLSTVLAEFADEIEAIGLSFPGDIDAALDRLAGHISDSAAMGLRRATGLGGSGDTWTRLSALGADRLLPVIATETPEVAAVVLSKLQVARAAELLSLLPGAQARRIVFAIPKTADIAPEAVGAIGQALLDAFEAAPVSAFGDGAVARTGAILNSATADVRDDVLEGLEAEDRDFANEVRAAIFTFANIPERIAPRDVPRVLRELDEETLLTALGAAKVQMPTVLDYVLEHLSSRMADQLRDTLGERPPPPRRTGEAAMAAVVERIREMEATGELVLTAAEAEAEAEM